MLLNLMLRSSQIRPMEIPSACHLFVCLFNIYLFIGLCWVIVGVHGLSTAADRLRLSAAYGILVPWPASSALRGRFLTTGPGKSQYLCSFVYPQNSLIFLHNTMLWVPLAQPQNQTLSPWSSCTPWAFLQGTHSIPRLHTILDVLLSER